MQASAHVSHPSKQSSQPTLNNMHLHWQQETVASVGSTLGGISHPLSGRKGGRTSFI